MYSVLVVDDSEIIRSVLCKTLKITNIPLRDILIASNGREAVNILNQSWIDIVLTDLNMPVMSGFDLIDTIYSRHDLNLIPIIVISTEGSTVKIDDLKKKGVKGYLRKPFTPEAIRDTLVQVTGGWNG